LIALKTTDGLLTTQNTELRTIIGGGTDLYVQKHDELVYADINFVFDNAELNGIKEEGNKCVIGPSATVTGLKALPLLIKHFLNFHRYAKLVSSTPIRNMATIAGNFINASPIGDLTIFFLALDTRIVLSNGKAKREFLCENYIKAISN
jgi:xanthine dehydrogenase small subunit